MLGLDERCIHTDCGTSRLAGSDYRELLAGHFGISSELVTERSVGDPRAAVAFDVELLRSNPLVPDTLVISGVVYNVETGVADLVHPPI